MKKFPVSVSLLLIFLFAYADPGFSGDDGAMPINGEFSGLIRHVDDFGRTFFDGEFKGTPGKATARGAGLTGPPLTHDTLSTVVPGHTCPNWGPNETGIQLMQAQLVLTFSDGSMIWGNAPDDGYACFTGYAYAPYDIMGGSGRFEGATGWIDFELQTFDYPPYLGLPRLATAETGTATGEIFLP